MGDEGTSRQRFRVVRELGRGGMGAVDLTFDGARGELVARKRVLRRADGGALLRFKREFRAVEELSHPALVRVHELGEDSEGLFFTMEAIEGVDLATYLRGAAARLESSGARPRPLSSAATLESDDDHPQEREDAPSPLDHPREHEDTLERSVAPGSVAPSGISRVVTIASEASVEPTVRASSSDDVATDPTVQVDSRGSLAHESATGRSTRATPVHLGRLAHVLPQLLEGLAFLHASGIVHRDLKPANILVRRDGALKVLDFGILAELGARAERDGEIVGTIGYMAPEQARGAPPSPATDRYALGVILFELFAGRVPHEGKGLAGLTAALLDDAPSLASFAPTAPPPVIEVVDALLARDPEARPSLEAVADVLLPALGARAPVFVRARDRAVSLVGREAERSRLASALERASEGHFELVVLAGPTGAGKSAVVAALAADAERRGHVVLRGRARAAERVAFNGIDEAVDLLAVATTRRRRGKHEGDANAPDRALASRLFPVLVDAGGESSFEVPTLVERAGAVAALARIVGRAAERAGALVWIADDLQWADEDALAVIGQLVDLAPARVCLVATLRDDVDETAAHRWLTRVAARPPRAGARVERVALAPLSTEAIAQIVSDVARAYREQRGNMAVEASIDVDSARAAAAVCAGRPLLAEWVGRALAVGASVEDPATLLAHAIDAADEDGRAALVALVAAGEWVRVGALARALATNAGACEDALRALVDVGLVRRAGLVGPDGEVTLYHDTVRVAAERVIAPHELRVAHTRLADLWIAEGGADDRIVRHLVRAERIDEAAERAPRAAEDAAAIGAFALAAELYGIALLRASPDEAALRAARARMLDHAAQYAAAALEWRVLGEGACDGDERRTFALAEAHSLLSANAVTEGRDRLDAVLRASGDPGVRPSVAALLAGVGFLLGPRRVRPMPALPPPRGGDGPASSRERAEGEKGELDVRVGIIVGYFDPLAGIRFLRRAQKTFVRRGDGERAAWVDLLFGYFALFGAPRRGPVRLASRYIDAARVRYDGDARTLDVQLLPRFLEGIAAQRDGRWDESEAALDDVVEALERGGLQGTFAHMLCLVHRVQVPYFAQRLDDAAAWQRRFIEGARACDDSAMRCHVDFVGIQIDTLRGALDAASARGAELRAQWGPEPTFQRFVTVLDTALPEVYRTDGREALTRILRARAEHRRFRPWATMYAGSFAAIAALCEANAMRVGDPRASMRRLRSYAKLAIAAPPLGHVGALRAMAYACDARGEPPERALVWLERAEREATEFGQVMDASIARYQRGLRIGGDEGAGLRADAHRAIDAAGGGRVLCEEDVGLR